MTKKLTVEQLRQNMENAIASGRETEQDFVDAAKYLVDPAAQKRWEQVGLQPQEQIIATFDLVTMRRASSSHPSEVSKPASDQAD